MKSKILTLTAGLAILIFIVLLSIFSRNRTTGCSDQNETHNAAHSGYEMPRVVPVAWFGVR